MLGNTFHKDDTLSHGESLPHLIQLHKKTNKKEP